MREETIAIDYLQFCFYLYFDEGSLLYYVVFLEKHLFILANEYIYESFRRQKME